MYLVHLRLGWRSMVTAEDRISEAFRQYSAASDNFVNRQVSLFYTCYISVEKIIATVCNEGMRLG